MDYNKTDTQPLIFVTISYYYYCDKTASLQATTFIDYWG